MENTNIQLSREILQQLLNYNETTGKFTWLFNLGVGRNNKGDIAGTLNKNGYTYIGIGSSILSAHALAFLYKTGRIPKEIDHIDHDKSNNTWTNLRGINHNQNCKNRSLNKNNKHGIPGISKTPTGIRAVINRNKKLTHLYHGKDFFEACCARKSAELKDNYHENHGNKRDR